MIRKIDVIPNGFEESPKQMLWLQFDGHQKNLRLVDRFQGAPWT